MKAELIFDSVNDAIYTNADLEFIEHVQTLVADRNLKYGSRHDAIKDDVVTWKNKLDPNAVMEIFLPLLASQRLVTSQMKNSYTSVQCEDVCICLSNHYGYSLLVIGPSDQYEAKKRHNIFLTFVQYLVGPCMSILKRSPETCTLLTNLITIWEHLRDSDQTFLIEAYEQLKVNSDLSEIAIKALQASLDKFQESLDVSSCLYSLLLVKNKLLAQHSSQQCEEIKAADILFAILLTEVISSNNCQREEDPEEKKVDSVVINRADNSRWLFYLKKPDCSFYSPFLLYYSSLADDIHFVVALEINSQLSEAVGAVLSQVQQLQPSSDEKKECGFFEREPSQRRKWIDQLDSSVKKVVASCKSLESPLLEQWQIGLVGKWEIVKGKLMECIKSSEVDLVCKVEALAIQFQTLLLNIYSIISSNMAAFSPPDDMELFRSASHMVGHEISDISNFLKIKTICNMTMESRYYLSINKYLDEFPGLLHFIYIDRNKHILTSPNVDEDNEMGLKIKAKTWSMVKFAWANMPNDQFVLMWRDKSFSYAYFVWFEDSLGSPLQMKQPLSMPTSEFAQLQNGCFHQDFYRILVKACFGQQISKKANVQCFELFCIHLGLVTSSVVLDQARKLTTSVWGLTYDGTF